MAATLHHIQAITGRVLRQLARDRRFLGLSLAAPLVISYMLWVFFQGADSPMIDPSRFVVPIGAFIVHFITYILCAIVLVRERTAQTLTRMFVNGYGRFEIIGGYLVAYSILATVQSLLALAALNWLFELNYGLETFASLYVVMWLLAVISIMLGIFISNFALNEGQVFPFIPLVTMPTVFFSGVILPVERLPEWASGLSVLTPLYFANRVIQTLIQPGGSLTNDWGSLLALPLYGVILLILATLTLRERD